MMFGCRECWRLDFACTAALANKIGESAAYFLRWRYESQLIAGRMEMKQQAFDWPADRGVQHPGRDFRGRLEHKPPERHPRMRQREHRRFRHFVAIEQDVDIDCTGRPTFCGL